MEGTGRAGIPLVKQGRNYTPPKGGALRPAGGLPPESRRFPAASRLPSIITGDATLPLRWLPPATLLWNCRLKTPCVASHSQPTS